MFIASVLAFCGGIYLQALYGFRLAPLLPVAAAIIIALPFFAKSGRIFALLMLAGFMVCGATRLSFIDAGQRTPDETGGKRSTRVR